MSYIVPLDNENMPSWVKIRINKVKEDPLVRRMFDGKPWIWIWNENYTPKMKIRNGKLNLEFETESQYTWFVL